jgi:hypothetical protein
MSATSCATHNGPIRAAKIKYPELRSISKATKGQIGSSTDIIVKERVTGWNIVFCHGWGDCPSGCINNRYWYISVEKTGEVTKIGEYLSEYDSESNQMKRTGKPHWGIPH